MKVERIIVFMLAAIIVGCAGKGPQRPSHRMGEAPQSDSAQLALLALNGRLAAEADKELRRIVSEREEGYYALYDRGTWVHFYEQGDDGRRHIMRNETCVLHMRIYSLSGQLYRDEEKLVRIGQREVPQAIDMNIIEWNHGARVEVLAPWYSAYGVKGKDEIPPYENLRIELEVE